jgi:NAD+ kinase
MAKIGVVVRASKEEVGRIVGDLIAWCSTRSDELIFEADSAFLPEKGAKVSNLETLARDCDPVVTLGGDGTLISVARFAAKTGSRLLGVNFGTLGFLTEVSPDELIKTLEGVLAGTAEFETRSLIEVDVLRGEKVCFSSLAINDAVIENGVRSALIELDVAIRGVEVMRLRADGLICATPTGSTAYSLAAGGSIIHPALAAMMLTPICPHSLTVRPLVLPAGSKDQIIIKIPKQKSKTALAIDGQLYFELNSNDAVHIKPAAQSVQIVRSPSKSYFEILRTKLNWGVANRSN